MEYACGLTAGWGEYFAFNSSKKGRPSSLQVQNLCHSSPIAIGSFLKKVKEENQERTS